MEFWKDTLHLKNVLHTLVKEFHKKRIEYSMKEVGYSHKEFTFIKELLTIVHTKISVEESDIKKKTNIVDASDALLQWITTENHDDETRGIITSMDKKKLVKHVLKKVFEKKGNEVEEGGSPLSEMKLSKTDETASCNLFESQSEFNELSSAKNLFKLSY